MVSQWGARDSQEEEEDDPRVGGLRRNAPAEPQRAMFSCRVVYATDKVDLCATFSNANATYADSTTELTRIGLLIG